MTRLRPRAHAVGRDLTCGVTVGSWSGQVRRSDGKTDAPGHEAAWLMSHAISDPTRSHDSDGTCPQWAARIGPRARTPRRGRAGRRGSVMVGARRGGRGLGNSSADAGRSSDALSRSTVTLRISGMLGPSTSDDQFSIDDITSRFALHDGGRHNDCITRSSLIFNTTETSPTKCV